MGDLETLLDQVHQRAEAPGNATWSLPPECYRSESLFALECERIFLREWLCVGRVDQIPRAGDYRCVDVIDEPLVMVRGADGVVRVLSRVCRHRAMEIAEGTGNTDRFICPYHSWTYGLDGQLLAAPQMQQSRNFEQTNISLPAFRTEIWRGFVFVNLDGKADSIAQRLKGLEERIGHYPLDELATTHEHRLHCDWNWKLMVENFAECYHHLGTHSESVEPYFPSRQASTEPFDPAYVLTTVPARLENFGDWERLPTLVDPPEQGIIVVVVYPALLLVFGMEPLWWLQVFPKGPNAFELRVQQCVKKDVAASPRFEKLMDEYFAEFLQVNDEDMAICRALQRGLGSRFVQSGPLSHLEEPLHRFFKYLAHHLKA